MCCVYRHLNSDGEVIYVGQTNGMYARQQGHKNGCSHITNEHRNEIAKIEQFETTSQVDSDLLEIYYINKYQPKYNKSWKHSEPMSLEIIHSYLWKEYTPEIKDYKKHADGVNIKLTLPNDLRTKIWMEAIYRNKRPCRLVEEYLAYFLENYAQ